MRPTGALGSPLYWPGMLAGLDSTCFVELSLDGVAVLLVNPGDALAAADAAAACWAANPAEAAAAATAAAFGGVQRCANARAWAY